MATIAEWQFGAHMLGVEDIRGGEGLLGVAYGNGVDTRFDDSCLAPLLTAVDLSGSDAAGGGSVGTANTVRAVAFSESMNAPDKAVFARGTKLGAIRLDTRVSIFDGTAEGGGSPYGEDVWDLIYTKSAAGTQEISVGFKDTVYRVITDIPETGGYTASANDESYKIATFGNGGSDAAAPVIAGIGKGSGSVYKVFSNTLSGTVTMDASAWLERAVLGSDITPTGFAMDGRFWLPATNDGIYFLDSDGQRFRPQQEALPTDPNNNQGFGTQTISYLGPGVLNPVINGLRLTQALNTQSVGVELYPYNTTPVTGRYGHATESPTWVYMPIYNTITGASYVCAMRPRQPGDQHPQPLSWYVLYELAAKESKLCRYSGFKGGVSNGTVWVGRGSDVSWFTEANTRLPWSDTSQAFGTSGTLYGTLLRRNPDRGKSPEWVHIETAGCTASNTIAVDLVMVDHRGTEQTVRCGGPIVSNGRHRLPVPPGMSAEQFYPKVTFVGAGGNATPRIKYGRLAVMGSTGELAW